jgi:hemin uptake protein HemP
MGGKSKNSDYSTFQRTAGMTEQGRVAPQRPPRVTTDRLMHGYREIVVQHGCVDYRLRITATGKLILTK